MTDIKTWQQGGETTQDPVLGSLLVDANILIEGGRLVWARIDTGYAVNSTYALANPTNVRCLGKCIEHTDNTTTNTFSNSGLAGGASVRFNQGLFLCNNDGSIVLGSASAPGTPLWLVSDVTGTNNGLVTVGSAPSSAGTLRPYVGYLAPPEVYPNVNPDALKIPVRVGRPSGTGPIAGAIQQEFTNVAKVFTTAFAVAPGWMFKFNPAGATFAITFPAITQAIDGMQLALVNVGTGSTATVVAPTGSDNIGNSAGASTGATAAGPTAGVATTYTADNTQKAWLTGL